MHNLNKFENFESWREIERERYTRKRRWRTSVFLEILCLAKFRENRGLFTILTSYEEDTTKKGPLLLHLAQVSNKYYDVYNFYRIG